MLTTCHNHLGMTARSVRELKTLLFTSFTTAHGVVSCAIAEIKPSRCLVDSFVFERSAHNDHLVVLGD